MEQDGVAADREWVEDEEEWVVENWGQGTGR